LPTVGFHPSAERDLLEIVDHLASRSPSAAHSLVDRVEEKCQLLADSPHIGRVRHDLAIEAIPDLRSFSVGSYGLFYRPVDSGIEVIRVLHLARDIGSAFAEGTA